MTIKEQKDFLRKNIKAKRNKLSKETVLQKSNIICKFEKWLHVKGELLQFFSFFD